MPDMTTRPLALVVGLGEGLGANLATTFASAGYDVAGLSRTERVSPTVGAAVREAGGAYTHLVADLTLESQVVAAVRPIRDRVDVLICAAHTLLIRPFAETSSQEFEAVWRVGCLGPMLVCREVLPGMVVRRAGTIIFTGATASVKGGAGFSAFASAKFALRGFAQALAREFGPKGVHVAHVVVDGLIEEPQTVARFGAASAVRLDAGAIADAYLYLAQQHRSTWSHEIDLRPFAEKF
jgi:NAD(P)-dependent dehydrogenase (short-subunit alcohol dehydrogenase family)